MSLLRNQSGTVKSTDLIPKINKKLYALRTNEKLGTVANASNPSTLHVETNNKKINKKKKRIPLSLMST